MSQEMHPEAPPEPFLSMIRAIPLEDVFVILELRATGEVVRVVRVAKDAPAAELHYVQTTIGTREHFRTRTVSGRALRQLIVEMGRALGVITLRVAYPINVDTL